MSRPKHCLDLTKDHLVQALHEHFDRDKDGFLKYPEISALQQATSGETMTENQYVIVCRTLQCHPGEGISLTALRLTYAAEGTNVAEDYAIVFDKSPVTSKEEHTDDIYEVGEGGVDISS
jgi:hypothetical protein